MFHVEHRLFDPASPPEWLDPKWWRGREHCDHLGSPTGAHTARLHAAAELAVKAAGPFPELGGTVNPIIDLGAGDGALLELVGRRPHAWGYEIIRSDVEYARNVRNVEVHLRLLDLEALTKIPLGAAGYTAGVVVLTEVLEHMADPHAFLRTLATREEVRYVVASSPMNETPSNHEWNHAWCWDWEGYRAMFEAAGFVPREGRDVEWSQVWLFKRRVELTTEEAVAALEDDQTGGAFVGDGR
jgi:hypothetical protein